MEDSARPERQTQVRTEIAELEESAVQLGDLLDRLAARLDTVLDELPPSDEKPKDEASPSVVLAGDIRRSRNRIRTMCDFVSSLIRRLEL